MARRDNKTIDIFNDYEPEPVAVTYSPGEIKAVSVNGKIARAISKALDGQDREAVAREMSEFLGEDVPKNMLDAYCSEAREDRNISVSRLIALIAATEEYRLISLISEPFDLAVIPKKYIHAVNDAMLADQIKRLEIEQAKERKTWKAGR